MILTDEIIDELGEVFNKRVSKLESVLHEREDRRAAIDTAKIVFRMIEVRRDRAVRIHKNVNLCGAIAAVASTLLIVAVMI